MISLNIQFDITELVEKFDKIRTKIRDTRPLMAQGAPLLLKEFQRTFAEEGPGWPKNRRGTRTLIKTGQLYQSFTRPGATGNIYVIDNNFARVGSELPYAIIHDQGLSQATNQRKSGRIKMPRRRILKPVSPGLIDKMEKFATVHFEEVFR